MEWQPIETAPKDVFPDVLVWDGYQVTLAYHAADFGWIDARLCDPRSSVRVEPTHWMPLPEPPNA